MPKYLVALTLGENNLSSDLVTGHDPLDALLEFTSRQLAVPELIPPNARYYAYRHLTTECYDAAVWELATDGHLRQVQPIWPQDRLDDAHRRLAECEQALAQAELFARTWPENRVLEGKWDVGAFEAVAAVYREQLQTWQQQVQEAQSLCNTWHNDGERAHEILQAARKTMQAVKIDEDQAAPEEPEEPKEDNPVKVQLRYTVVGQRIRYPAPNSPCDKVTGTVQRVDCKIGLVTLRADSSDTVTTYKFNRIVELIPFVELIPWKE